MTPRNLAATATSILALLVSSAGATAAPISTDGLETATPKNLSARAASSAGEPNLPDQWAFARDAVMGLLTAWRQITGGDVTVAIVDSGTNLGHKDLVDNLWTNAGEVPGNGIDDDRNGFVDDVRGYDFVDRDGDPSDENGHGTHVAGIVGARGDNGVGGSGVAQRVRLMTVRVLDENASGTTDKVAQGIRYAVDNGARIVNLSLAGPTATNDVQDAIRYAKERGALIVAAAGNYSSDLAKSPSYPVSFSDDNVIGVAATDDSLNLADISNFGTGADIAAPGADILSTAVDGGYEWRTGTSMASPAIAGTLALIASARPDLNADGLRDALYSGATAGNLPVAFGSVNAAGSLRKVIAPSNWKEAPATTVTTPKPRIGVTTPGAVKRSTASAAVRKASAKKRACIKAAKKKRSKKAVRAALKKCSKIRAASRKK